MADPIASVIVAILIIISGWRVLKDSFHILMEGAPAQIHLEEVKDSLMNIANVKEVHDLHIWSITSGMPMLSCHISILEKTAHDTVLREAQVVLHDHFGIEHSTIQVESTQKGVQTIIVVINGVRHAQSFVLKDPLHVHHHVYNIKSFLLF